MTSTVALVGHELLFLAICGVIGSGLVSILPTRSWDVLARFSLAPACGLALATSLFTCLEWWWPGSTVGWLIPILAIISAALAGVVKLRRGISRSHGRPYWAILYILFVIFVVSAPGVSLLLAHHSSGPTSYEVYDTVGYVAEADAAKTISIHRAEQMRPPYDNEVQSYWANLVQGVQQLDIAPFAGALDSLLGDGATATQSGFLLAVIAIGGLACFGSLQPIVRGRVIIRVLVATFWGGSFYLQLFADGSQAALVGLSLLVPLLLLGYRAVVHGERAEVLATSVLFAGILTNYPIEAPAILIATFAVVAFGLVHDALRRLVTPLMSALRRAAIIAIIFMAAAALNLVSFKRDLHYWNQLAHGHFVQSGFPYYQLGLGVVPGWLGQFRGLYLVAFGPESPLRAPIFAIVAPVILLFIIGNGIRSRLGSILAVPFASLCISALFATYQASHNSCGYCEDRNLLPVTPLLAIAIAAGIAGFMDARSRRVRISGSCAIAAVLIFTLISVVQEWQRFSSSSYFLTTSTRSFVTLSRIDSTQPVLLEGFGSGPQAPAEEPIMYELLYEQIGDRISFATDQSDHAGLAYFGIVALPNPEFRSHYEIVVTRTPEIVKDRTLLSQSSGIGVERRRAADVLIDSGISLPTLSSGIAQGVTVSGPIEFVVTGAVGPLDSLETEFLVPPGTPHSSMPGSDVRFHSERLTVCTPLKPSHSLVIATIRPPGIGVTKLLSVSVRSDTCRRLRGSSQRH